MCNNDSHTTQKSTPRLKEKAFEERNSLVTELLESKNFVTVKCLFYAVLFGFVGNDVLHGLVFGKKVDYGFRLIIKGFAKFDLVILIWCGLFCVTILTFYLFKLWANIRFSFKPKSFSIKLWDYIFLLGIVCYYGGLLIITPIFIKVLNTGALSSTVLLFEQMRFMMKTHSYVRSNVPQVKSYKPHSDQQLLLPNLKHYLYFLFAPTAIYRNEYPRTKHIDKIYVLQCFVEVLLVMWLQSFLMDIFFVRKFENTGVHAIDWVDVCAAIMQNVIGGFLFFITFCYQLLDRWLNGWAELLRFADRRFYEDWWTCTNYSTFLRKWNIVVQDWLFHYVYKDFFENIVPNNRRLAKFMVFLISALFHEYLLIFILDQFFPLLFFNFFVLGQLLANYYIDSKHPFFNMVTLYSLGLGNSYQLSLYTMELHARKHCFDNSTWSYFKPRILTSDCRLNALTHFK